MSDSDEKTSTIGDVLGGIAEPFIKRHAPQSVGAIGFYPQAPYIPAVATFSLFQHAVATLSPAEQFMPEKRNSECSFAMAMLGDKATSLACISRNIVRLGQTPNNDQEQKMRTLLGEAMRHMAHICNVMGWSMEELAELGVQELQKRAGK